MRHVLRVATMCFLTCGALARVAGGAESPLAAEEPESPRLRALATALRAGDVGALDGFWQEIDRGHAPLIEAINERGDPPLRTPPGDPGNERFTFLWRGQPDQTALNVVLNTWLPLHKSGGWDSFTRLGASNVWYCSYVLPRTVRLRYELIAPKGWQPAVARVANFSMNGMEYEAFLDPLNPRQVHWNNSDRSFTQGSAAVVSPYLQKHEATPAGKVETLPIESNILKGGIPPLVNPPPKGGIPPLVNPPPKGGIPPLVNPPLKGGIPPLVNPPLGTSRVLRVYLPPGYESSRASYGLLLAYDGVQYTEAVPTPVILDNMIAAHAIPPLIAVFLESPNRDVEFPPNDSFQQFVGTELMPLLRKHYRLSSDPRQNTVLGSSYGGIAAAYTAWVHPDLFGNVISQSGSFGWFPALPDPSAPPPRGIDPNSGWLIKKIAEAPRKPLRFYLDAGIWEGGGMLFGNRMLHSVLIGKGYDVVYEEGDGVHSSYYWMLRLPDALQAMLGKRAK